MNTTNRNYLVLTLIIIAIVIGSIGYFVLFYNPPILKIEDQLANNIPMELTPPTKTNNPQVNTQNPSSQQSSTTSTNETINWKTYKGKTFEFKYPEKLQLSIDNNKVILNHSISYENSGDCDMVGGGKIYKTLDDFDISFEIVSQKITPNYIDGQYNIGMLNGPWAYEGAEGCGYSKYYYYIDENKTLVIQKASIQALSGISSSWDLKKILYVPGVISKQESEKLFNQILSTFKFI